MNESRLNGGPIGNTYPGREIEVNESYGVEEHGMDEIVMEDRGDVVMENRNESYSVRNVHIRPLHHGYVVKLDCHEFAFESADRALKYITEYLKDPQGTEQKWWKDELFK